MRYSVIFFLQYRAQHLRINLFCFQTRTSAREKKLKVSNSRIYYRSMIKNVLSYVVVRIVYKGSGLIPKVTR